MLGTEIVPIAAATVLTDAARLGWAALDRLPVWPEGEALEALLDDAFIAMWRTGDTAIRADPSGSTYWSDLGRSADGMAQPADLVVGAIGSLHPADKGFCSE